MTVALKHQRVSVREYYELDGSGILGPENHTELIEGEIIEILGLRQLCEQRQGINIPLGGEFLRSLDKPGRGAFELLKRGVYRDG